MCIHDACGCVTMYWAVQHILIISNDFNDAMDDEDRYDDMGYGTDLEEWIDECCE